MRKRQRPRKALFLCPFLHRQIHVHCGSLSDSQRPVTAIAYIPLVVALFVCVT